MKGLLNSLCPSFSSRYLALQLLSLLRVRRALRSNPGKSSLSAYSQTRHRRYKPTQAILNSARYRWGITVKSSNWFYVEKSLRQGLTLLKGQALIACGTGARNIQRYRTTERGQIHYTIRSKSSVVEANCLMSGSLWRATSSRSDWRIELPCGDTGNCQLLK